MSAATIDRRWPRNARRWRSKAGAGRSRARCSGAKSRCARSPTGASRRPASRRWASSLMTVVRDYENFFMPSMKLTKKIRDGALVTKRYDAAQTPYQRVLASPHVSKASRPACTSATPRSIPPPSNGRPAGAKSVWPNSSPACATAKRWRASQRPSIPGAYSSGKTNLDESHNYNTAYPSPAGEGYPGQPKAPTGPPTPHAPRVSTNQCFNSRPPQPPRHLPTAV